MDAKVEAAGAEPTKQGVVSKGMTGEEKEWRQVNAMYSLLENRYSQTVSCFQEESIIHEKSDGEGGDCEKTILMRSVLTVSHFGKNNAAGVQTELL